MRIFIDCSYIDFSRQPTGIPRVVLQYIQNGYAWAESRGVEVYPVVTTPSGLMPVRPVPGVNPPAYLQQLAEDTRVTSPAVAQSLDQASFHMQAALLAAGSNPQTLQCRTALQNIFRSLRDDGEPKPFTIKQGDLLFCPAYWHDVEPDFFWSVQRQGCRIITLVHDVLPITFGKFYQSPWKEQFYANLLAHVRRADALFAVSQYTASSIAEIAERHGLSDRKIEVAPNGFAPLVGEGMADQIENGTFTPVISRGAAYEILAKRRPFIMVGSVEPKKGHIPVIRSMEALWDAGFEPSLAIIGRKGWLEASVVHAIEQSPYFGDKLYWFQDFDDVDLRYAYHQCRALIFASYAEGFGIPMVEALLSQRPVVAYDTPVNREVLGGHGLFFDCFAAFAQHLVNLADDGELALARENTRSFSWPLWSQLVPQLFDSLADRFSKIPTPS
jgi:alpha-1,2-rhamnosyltransferase